MCAVKGIVMNASVLLAVNDDENGIPSLAPAADYLLRKLRYSNIYIGISYGPDLSAPKVRLLQENARLYSYNCFVFRPSAIDNFVSAVSLEWGDNIGSYMHVISSYKDEEISQLISSGWLITVLRSPGKASAVEYNPGTESPSKIFINKLEELPLTICHLNKKAMGKEVETVGYLMKPSREEDFAKLQQLDGVLHKATDDIITVEMSSSSDFENKVTYTEGMQELQRCIGCHPECRVIDPFSNIYPVLDRLKIQQILGGLENLNSKSCSKIRGPHFLKATFQKLC